MTLYSGAFAFVLVDTNTSTGIHYIEMMTLYSVSGEGLAPIVSAYSRLILVDGTVL